MGWEDAYAPGTRRVVKKNTGRARRAAWRAERHQILQGR
jgi:hypothetical protein